MTADVTISTPPSAPHKGAAQPPAIGKNRSENDYKPMHASTESTLAPTSEFARYFLLALPARYVFRGLLGSAFNKHAPEWMKTPVNKFLDWASVNRTEKHITEVINKNPLQGYRAGMNEDQINTLLNEARNAPLKQGLDKALKRISGDELGANTLAYAYKNKGGREITTTSINKIRDAAREHYGKVGYGLALGIGSSILTASYANMVYNDLKNVFGEAVAYELDKDPHSISFADIQSSKNVIVKQSVDNFWSRTATRALSDIPFFASWKFPNLEIADFMIGVKAALLFGESWRRKTTMFEDIVALVNSKINTRNGLGQPISEGEIFDLFQHYGESIHSPKVFNTIIERNSNDSLVWAKGHKVFSRITELMNQTYAYKHNSLTDSNGNLVIQADFALPKFIYLLGHNLIDPSDPEHTLAYVETANSYGMQAVKDVQSMFAHGASVQDVISKYPANRYRGNVNVEDDKNSLTDYTNKGGVKNFDLAPKTTLEQGARRIMGNATSIEDSGNPLLASGI
jgi:hypothetical protein